VQVLEGEVVRKDRRHFLLDLDIPAGKLSVRRYSNAAAAEVAYGGARGRSRERQGSRARGGELYGGSPSCLPELLSGHNGVRGPGVGRRQDTASLRASACALHREQHAIRRSNLDPSRSSTGLEPLASPDVVPALAWLVRRRRDPLLDGGQPEGVEGLHHLPFNDSEVVSRWHGPSVATRHVLDPRSVRPTSRGRRRRRGGPSRSRRRGPPRPGCRGGSSLPSWAPDGRRPGW
jgi:hypothetical protein